jgi:hypothetical protein
MLSRQEAFEQRRHNLRLVFVIIIMFTIPFYCAGVFLWGTAPPRNRPTLTPNTPPPTGAASLVPATNTPFGQVATITPLPITIDVPTAGAPTFGFPTADIPTAVIPTRYLSPTPPIVLPTAAPFVTDTPVPPPITFTPLPFDTLPPP